MREIDLIARYDTLPEGFVEHDGGECPLPDAAFAEMMIQTSEGIGSTGETWVGDHVWEWGCINGEGGRIIGYRDTGKRKPRSIEDFIAHQRDGEILQGRVAAPGTAGKGFLQFEGLPLL